MVGYRTVHHLSTKLWHTATECWGLTVHPSEEVVCLVIRRWTVVCEAIGCAFVVTVDPCGRSPRGDPALSLHHRHHIIASTSHGNAVQGSQRLRQPLC